MNCLKLAKSSSVAIQSQDVINHLIDIFWSNVVNKEVITQSLHCMLIHPSIPDKLQSFMDLMKERETAENPCNPFYIIEPYGEALETLNPDYFSYCRAVYYQE